MTLLLALFLKSLLIFAAAGIVLFLLRRSSAAARHLVCLLTLGAMLALPLFSLVLPSWRLPVLEPTSAQHWLPEGQALSPPGTGRVRVGAPLIAPSGLASSALVPAPGSTPASHQMPAPKTPSLPTSGGPLRSNKVGPYLFVLYALGFFLASARPLLGLWGISSLRRQCVAVDDASTMTAADNCARLLQLDMPHLCHADVPVPMTWGWLRPIVLLPLTSANWPDDRLCSVLLHEMAHVKRRDWLGHRLADFACALYWFHPLVWLTARRLRSESELACDDLVLASGIAAPEYARHLLEIAGSLSHASSPPNAAIAMAQTSRIEGRITMILDKTRTRRTLTRRVLLVALIPGTAALVTLAILRPDAKAQTAPVASSVASVIAASSSQTLLSVEDLTLNGQSLLAGVTDANKPGSSWWSASGAILPTPVYDTNAYHSENHADSSKHTVSFAFRLPSTARDTTVRYELPQATQSSSDGFWPTKLRENARRNEAQLFPQSNGTRVVTAAYPSSLTKTSLRVGIASSLWKTAASDRYMPNPVGAIGLSGSVGIEDSGAKFLFSPVSATKDGAVLSVSTDATSDLRVVAMTTQGQTVLPDQIGDNSIGTLDQITARFSLPLSQIKEFRVETRPFRWVEYRDVALQPVQ